MLKTGKRLGKRRRFSEDFKRKIVEEFEKGGYSVNEMGRIYNLDGSTIYKWIYKFSTYNQKNTQIIEMKDSQTNKLKELENKVKQLERVVGQKQLMIDYLEKMMELAKEHYDIDIKKNFDSQRSGGSEKTDQR
jgi:transposase